MVITSQSNTEEWHNLPSPPPSSLPERAELPNEKLDPENLGHDKKPLQSSGSSLSNTLTDGATVDWEAGNSNTTWDGDSKSAHATGVDAIATKFHIDLQHGLDGNEAKSRLDRDGPNQLETAAGISAWRILLRQVSNSLTIVRISKPRRRLKQELKNFRNTMHFKTHCTQKAA